MRSRLPVFAVWVGVSTSSGVCSTSPSSQQVSVAIPLALHNFLIVIVYFFYPETAGRTLEDLDRYFAGDAPLLVFRDKEVIASKRPEKFIENEKAEIRRHSSVVAGDVQAANAAYQRKSRTEGAEFHEDV